MIKVLVCDAEGTEHEFEGARDLVLTLENGVDFVVGLREREGQVEIRMDDPDYQFVVIPVMSNVIRLGALKEE